ncbi:hypothetical protein Rin_00021360, partial [Candidatus Regiella insecticola 5.15]
DLSAEIVGLRKDMEARFEKTDAQMEARFAQMEARFEKTDAQMEARFEKTETQIADVRKDFLTEMSLMRKDIEKSGMQTTIRLGGMLVVAVGVILAVLKIPF